MNKIQLAASEAARSNISAREQEKLDRGDMTESELRKRFKRRLIRFLEGVDPAELAIDMLEELQREGEDDEQDSDGL